ncbi:MAG: acyl-CoA dehydrogenase family protein [Acidimicrobiales bacterium]
MADSPVVSLEVLAAIRAQAGYIESSGRIPNGIVAELRESGICGALLPAELGGSEVAPHDLTPYIEALSAADGSTGWCAAVAVSMAVVSAYLPEEGAREIFTDSTVITGGSFQPSGRAVAASDGTGLRVTGRWGFGSGSLHADWMAGTCLLVDGDGEPALTPEGRPDARLVFFPTVDATVHNTWDAMGMQGTGSHDYSVEALDVPLRRTMPFVFTPWPAGTFWRMPAMSVVVAPFAGVPLGIAQAAIDELVALASVKTPYRSTRRLAERDVAQAMAARAEAAVASARAFLHMALLDEWEAVQRGEEVTMRQRAQVRLAVVNAASASRQAVDLCLQAAGSTALSRDHPLQRQFRDAHTAGQHVVLALSGYETVGRVMFGLEPDTALI